MLFGPGLSRDYEQRPCQNLNKQYKSMQWSTPTGIPFGARRISDTLQIKACALCAVTAFVAIPPLTEPPAAKSKKEPR
jgi:hypothetical protein